jgi:tetratricopeptide (TPR) repeat protein
VEEIVPDFVDPATDGPLPEKEGIWILVTSYRVVLARRARHREQAERLQSLCVSRGRQRAAAILAKPPQAWTAREKDTVRGLSGLLYGLSEIQRERESAECVDGYLEAISLAEQISDTQGAAACALNLGRTYTALPEVRDLALAEQWHRRSFDLFAPDDRIGRAKCLWELGCVAYQRFRDARRADRPPDECLSHLSKAEQYYLQALDMLPANAVTDLATVHNYLGNIYDDAAQIDTALRHYHESIRNCEAMEDRFHAGTSRYNAAIALGRAGRPTDAHDWAQSALRDYQACENADQEIVDTLKLLERIEFDLRATSPPS